MAESPAPPAAVEAGSSGVEEHEQEQPRKKKRGVKGLPRGVTGPNKVGKYVARASFKPDPESKAQQRNLGSFATAEAAGAAVVEAESELNAGGAHWKAPARVNQHKRGEVCALLASVLFCAHSHVYMHRCGPLCRRRHRRRRSVSRASGT